MSVTAFASRDDRLAVDGERHYETVVIIGMLADQIHAPRRAEDTRFRIESRNEFGYYFPGIHLRFIFIREYSFALVFSSLSELQHKATGVSPWIMDKYESEAVVDSDSLLTPQIFHIKFDFIFPQQADKLVLERIF